MITALLVAMLGQTPTTHGNNTETLWQGQPNVRPRVFRNDGPRVSRLGADDYAFFEFAPSTGAGMGAACPVPNWLQNSEAVDTWAAISGTVAVPTVTANYGSVAAPDGTFSADRVQYPAVPLGSYSLVRASSGITVAGSTVSVYLRSTPGAGNQTIYISVPNTVHAACAVTESAWSRCSISSPALNGSLDLGFNYVALIEPSAAATDFLVWGGMFSVGTTLAQYVRVSGVGYASSNPTGAKGEALTFSRTSTAMCTKTATGGLATTGIANGDLVLEPAGYSRVEYDYLGTLGLLVESSRTNSALQSQAIGTAPWTTSASVIAAPTITADFAVAPDGTQTAERVQVPAASAGQWSFVIQSGFGSASFTNSIYLKGNGTSGTIHLLLGTTPNACVLCSYNSTSWSRCSLPYAPVVSGLIGVGNDLSDAACVAAGATSGAQDVFVWGAQAEAGAYATSYIPTTNSAAVRQTETATLAPALTTGSDFSIAETLTSSGFASSGCAGDSIFSATVTGPYLNSCFGGVGYGGVLTSSGGTGTNFGAGTSPWRAGIVWTASTKTSQINVNGTLGGSSTNAAASYAAWTPVTLGTVGIHSRVCADQTLTRCR